MGARGRNCAISTATPSELTTRCQLRRPNTSAPMTCAGPKMRAVDPENCPRRRLELLAFFTGCVSSPLRGQRGRIFIGSTAAFARCAETRQRRLQNRCWRDLRLTVRPQWSQVTGASRRGSIRLWLRIDGPRPSSLWCCCVHFTAIFPYRADESDLVVRIKNQFSTDEQAEAKGFHTSEPIPFNLTNIIGVRPAFYP